MLGLETATIREIVKILRNTYCRQIGVEFMHIHDPVAKNWLQERIEGSRKIGWSSRSRRSATSSRS